MLSLRSTVKNWFAYRQALCAAVLGFALFCGAVVPMIKLALPEPVSCGMECCLEEGVCCCVLSFAEQHDDDAPKLAHANLSNSCPPHCATAPSAAPTLTLKAERPSQFEVLVSVALNRPHEFQQRSVTNQSYVCASPRAPPVFPRCLNN